MFTFECEKHHKYMYHIQLEDRGFALNLILQISFQGLTSYVIDNFLINSAQSP